MSGAPAIAGDTALVDTGFAKGNAVLYEFGLSNATATGPVVKQFEGAIRRSLHRAGYEQPEATPLIGRVQESPPDVEQWALIAPGVIVRPKERQARFGRIDLEALRARMRPEVFAAFVRHIGVIHGPADVDVNDLADRLED